MVQSVLSFKRDITDHRRAEEKLRQSERKILESQNLLQAVVDGTTDAIYVKDLQGRYRLMNTAALRFTGKSSSEVIGNDDTLLFPAEEARAVMEGDRGVIAVGKTLTYEDHLSSGEGEKVIFLSTKGPIVDECGRVSGLFGISRDITGQKRAEESLRESEAKYRGLFEHMQEGCAYCRMIFENGDPVDFIYLSVNAAFETLTGLKDVAGKRVSEVIPGIRSSDPALFEAYGRVARTGKPEKIEIFRRSVATVVLDIRLLPGAGVFRRRVRRHHRPQAFGRDRQERDLLAERPSGQSAVHRPGPEKADPRDRRVQRDRKEVRSRRRHDLPRRTGGSRHPLPVLSCSRGLGDRREQAGRSRIHGKVLARDLGPVLRRPVRPLHLRDHRPQARRSREGKAAGPAPAGDEDGGGGPPGGGRGARLQQPADGDHGVQRTPAAEDREGIPDAQGSGGDQAGGGAGGVADAAAAGVLPEADHRAEGGAPGPPGGGDAQDADAPDRREHRVAGHHRQIPGIGEGRPGAVPADPDEPGGERPGCDAGRREDRDRDRERGPGRRVLCPPSLRETRAVRDAGGQRHGERDERRGQGAYLRAVLHHEGAGERNGAGPCDDLRRGEAGGWLHRGVLGGRDRDDLQGLPAACRGGGRRDRRRTTVRRTSREGRRRC